MDRRANRSLASVDLARSFGSQGTIRSGAPGYGHLVPDPKGTRRAKLQAVVATGGVDSV